MTVISISESSSRILVDERLDPRRANSIGIFWKSKLGLPGPAIQVTETSSGDSLRTDHVVGVLKVGEKILEIFPKFLSDREHDDWRQPFLNLVRFAHGHIGRSPDDVPASIVPASSFADVIGAIFDGELKQSFLRGLPRSYRERVGDSSILEGALDLSRLNSLVLFDGRIPFRSPFLSARSPISELIGWSAGRLAALCSAPELVFDLVRWNQRFAQLGNHRLPSNWKTIKVPRSFGYLQSLIEIGQLLANSQFPGIEYGESKFGFPGFVWRTADIYERAIYRLNSEALFGTGITVSKKSFGLLSIGGSSVMRTIPDLVYSKQGISVLVGDSKYKNRGSCPEPSDTYQVMAAADVTGCSRSILFYPSPGSEIGLKELDVSGFGQAQKIVVVDVGLDCFATKASIESAKKLLRSNIIELLGNKQVSIVR